MALDIPYGITVYQWMFGDGKTYHGFSTLYSDILVGENPYVIGNIPYSQVDLFYSSKEDMQSIVLLLCNYIMHTNVDHKLYYEYYDSQRPIIFIVDEAHLYFNSRDWASGQMSMMMIALSQCRKRKIKFIVISQKTWFIDKTFRVLADYTIKMQKTKSIIGKVTKAMTYYNPWDILDLDTDTLSLSDVINNEHKIIRAEQYLMDESIFFPLTPLLKPLALFDHSYHLLAQEQYNTVYVTWLDDTARAIPKMTSYYDRDWYTSLYSDLFDWLPPSILLPWHDITDTTSIPLTTHEKSESGPYTSNSTPSFLRRSLLLQHDN